MTDLSMWVAGKIAIYTMIAVATGAVIIFGFMWVVTDMENKIETKWESRWVEDYCLDTFKDIDRCRQLKFDYYRRWRK